MIMRSIELVINMEAPMILHGSLMLTGTLQRQDMDCMESKAHSWA